MSNEIRERLQKALNRFESYPEGGAEAGRLLAESVRDVLNATAFDTPTTASGPASRTSAHD